MAGPTRRSKPLKGTSLLESITGFSSVSPVAGDLFIYDAVDAQYENGQTLSGSYSIATASIDDLTANNAVTFGDNLSVTGTLSVTGATTLTTLTAGATSVSTLAASGAVTLDTTLTVAGALTGAGFSFSGSGTIVGNLSASAITGTSLTASSSSTLAAATATTLTVTGNTALQGTLSVSGLAGFLTDVAIGGNLSADAIAGSSLSTAGDASIGGNVSLSTGSSISAGTRWTIASTAADWNLTHLIADATITLSSTDTGLANVDMLVLDPNTGSTFADAVLVSTGNVTATTGNIVATAGDLIATAGAVNAGTTVTAGTGLTVTTGNATITAGNLVMTNGNVAFTSGSVTGATDIGTVTVTTTGKVTVGTEIEIDGALNHDGTTVGFYGVTPVVRASAYTQTFATASRTHANPTAAALTVVYTTDDPAIAPNGTITIADGDIPSNNELLEFCEELADQVSKLVTDLANAKQVINSLVDDSQAIGIAQ
jgi:hypothetical protein